jgi:methylated-DNA-protein-cysteine methyltransferase-like protein
MRKGKKLVTDPLSRSDKRPTDIPSNRDSFFEDVHDVVRQIPSGRITSYGAIARYLGSGLSARMVGWAMNASHVALPPVPAHRVVNRNGILSGKGHFATPSEMEELLRREGIQVINDKVIDFNTLFWDPGIELSLF